MSELNCNKCILISSVFYSDMFKTMESHNKNQDLILMLYHQHVLFCQKYIVFLHAKGTMDACDIFLFKAIKLFIIR